MSRLFDVDIVTDEQERNLNLNYGETEDIDLDSCIAEHCAQSEEKTNPNVYHLSKDMQWFEDTNTLTPNLKKLLDALNQMSPTSTPSEREFSISSHFMSKKRTQMEDETLDNLSFLKDTFKKETNFAFLNSSSW